jgi:hypothetical protein
MEEVKRVQFPGTVILYVCDGCGRTSLYHPHRHLSRTTGSRCTGTVWAQTFSPTGAPEVA